MPEPTSKTDVTTPTPRRARKSVRSSGVSQVVSSSSATSMAKALIVTDRRSSSATSN